MSWEAISGFLITLVAVYSPLGAAASYASVVGHFDVRTRRRISIGLTAIVAGFVVAAVWVGEAVIELLGVSTDTLSAVGGIALLYAAIPMMRGVDHVPPEDPNDPLDDYADEAENWRTILITPVAFPLSIGGTTMAISVSSAALASTVADLLALSTVGLVFAVIVGTSSYVGGAIPGRVGPTGRTVINRASGVLLTAIGVSLLVNSVTRMVLTVVQGAG